MSFPYNPGAGAGASTPNTSSTFTYLEGASTDASRRVYGTFAETHAAARAYADAYGWADLVFDDTGFSAEVLAGAWDMNRIIPRGRPNAFSASAFVRLREGASFTGLQIIGSNLSLQTDSTSPVLEMGANSFLTINSGSALVAGAGAEAWISVTAGTATINAFGAQLGINTSGRKVATIATGTTLQVFMSAGSVMSSIALDNFVGDGTIRLRADDHVVRTESFPGSLTVEISYPDIPGNWTVYTDSTFGTTPLVLASSVRTQLTIDGLGGGTIESYGETYWSGNKLRNPGVMGASYVGRVNLTLTKNSTGSDEIAFEFDIGDGSPIVISGDFKTDSGANGSVKTISVPIPYYALGTFITNGCAIYLTATGGSFDVDAASVYINRTR